jgi:hypothetical protein
MKRNHWVCKVRSEVLYSDGGIEEYNTLPSYEKMLYGWGFWRWDVKYFLGKNKSLPTAPPML